MKTIKDLKRQFNCNGTVQFICVRPQRVSDVVAKDSVVADIDKGLIGDHFNGKANDDRMVTFIQAEHIEVVQKMLATDVDPKMLRRNIVVSGLNLLALRGVQFRIGNAVFEGTKTCPPCSRMEENLGQGGYNAMRGHGGICAKVIETGTLKIGDSVIVLDKADSTTPSKSG